MFRATAFAALLAIASLALPLACSPPLATRYELIKSLAPGEEVFAYGRISPDGTLLVYSSETRGAGASTGAARIMRIYDVTSERVVFSEPGIDGYWAPDGRSLIYLSQRYANAVSILDMSTMEVQRNVAPPALGDYYSWGIDASGRDVILTIEGNYYYVTDGVAEEPFASVAPCSLLGPARRPLLSKDASLLTVFVEGTVAVRRLHDCDDIVFTNMAGAKADFSWDNRYIAFHVQNWLGRSRVMVVDLERRVSIPVTDFASSCMFPSWTADGRLCFLCLSGDYRGFVIAEDFLANPARPLPQTNPLSEAGSEDIPGLVTWERIFASPPPDAAVTVVLVCSYWSAHCPDAVRSLQQVASEIKVEDLDARVFLARVGGEDTERIRALFDRYGPDLPRLELRASRVRLTGAHNQIPTTLVFTGDVLEERYLGELADDVLRELVWQSKDAR